MEETRECCPVYPNYSCPNCGEVYCKCLKTSDPEPEPGRAPWDCDE